MATTREKLHRSFLYDWFGGVKQALDFRAWEKAGNPVPPPHRYKQQVILGAASATGARVLVETGTYLGDMVRAMQSRFREIYTMELDDGLYERARKKFDAWPHVHCLGGSSPDLLASILRRITEPCVFWLDGHYSGPGTAGRMDPCPVDRELAVIGAHHIKAHAVLIDDARLFNGTGGYPSLEEIDRLRARLFPGLRMTVEHDIIRLLPG
ncbi:MAG: hypothetical protein U1F77_00045 [Kiritimatiellia bacterium]